MFQANFLTDYPPDSIEWCPIRPDIFACGTYLYNPENTTRQGSIYLCQYNSSGKTIDVIQHQSTNGILDIKWIQPSSDCTFLSTVSALGQLSLYSVNDLAKPIICEEVTNDQTIALAHSWLHLTNNYVVISDQQGYLTICELDNTNGLRFSQSWLAHEYECWTCAWDKHDSNIIYSGADDTLFKIWDIRDCKQAIHINRKHTMGICSIISNENNPYEILTGSFDEYLRQWDKRQINEPLKEIKLGGGVWKIKPHPLNHDILLCACMHNGFVIVDLKTLMIICNYKQHGSLAYGCDWQYKDSVNQLADLMDDCMNEDTTICDKKILSDSLIASCSFYDKTVHVWKQQA
jgi:diphthamide biosynthesis protein 7